MRPPRSTSRSRRRPAPRWSLGAPKVTLSYSGTATDPDARVFAQIVDEEYGGVLGNQITPIPLTLDGQTHTVTRSLEVISATSPGGGAGFTLQITPSSTAYGPARAAGLANFHAIRVELPTSSVPPVAEYGAPDPPEGKSTDEERKTAVRQSPRHPGQRQAQVPQAAALGPGLRRQEMGRQDHAPAHLGVRQLLRQEVEHPASQARAPAAQRPPRRGRAPLQDLRAQEEGQEIAPPCAFSNANERVQLRPQASGACAPPPSEAHWARKGEPDMLRRSATVAAVATAALVATLGLSSSAFARDDSITSFDGTNIVLSFFPAANLPAGTKAPTVLYGPGWSSGRDTDENSASDPSLGSVGIGPLRAAGYNVLTWDPRGFGSSGGTVTVDGPDNEGRDVQALIDYVSHQPEAQLDRVGDPRVGMTGISYGGGIQLVTAGLDKRLDALVPDIAWHSLTTSLYKEKVVKAGWSAILYSTGKARGHLDPHIDSAFTSGALTGQLSADDEALVRLARPGRPRQQDPDPDLLHAGHRRHAVHARRGDHQLPHPARQQRPDQDAVVLRWARHLPDQPGRRDRHRARGDPVAQPLPQGRQARRHGPALRVDRPGRREAQRRRLPAEVLDAARRDRRRHPAAGQRRRLGSGRPAADRRGDRRARRERRCLARRQRGQRLDPSREHHEVGDRRAEGDHHLQRHGRHPDARVFGQIVDESSGVVAGNQITPIPLVLDGLPHTVTRPLEDVALTSHPGSGGYTLQITPSSQAYGPVEAAKTAPLGFREYRLADFGYLGRDFNPDAVEDHRVLVKGYIIRQPEFERISVTSVTNIAAECE